MMISAKIFTIWFLYWLFVLLAPPIMLGILRKVKARFQNRIGSTIFQPLYDLRKLINKGETISEITSWIFRNTTVINLAIIIVVATLVPWISFKPPVVGADLILVIYLFALARFFTVLAALDAGSAFGGFGASREVTLALLVEPAIILCFIALGCVAGTTDLTQIFAYSDANLFNHPALWALAGLGLFLASLVELSRMPVDDPTTHLELTMVHEAMILENSGRNLALVEYTHYLKMVIMLGVSGQCLLHTIPFFWYCSDEIRALASLLSLLVCVLAVAIIESTTVKLRWTKLPEFIAYSVALGLLCLFMSIVRG